MILLPLIYVAVIGTVGWLVYLQATQGHYLGSGIWAIITYLTPIIAGSIVIFFMVKPPFGLDRSNLPNHRRCNPTKSLFSTRLSRKSANWSDLRSPARSESTARSTHLRLSGAEPRVSRAVT